MTFEANTAVLTTRQYVNGDFLDPTLHGVLSNWFGSKPWVASYINDVTTRASRKSTC